MTEPLKQNSTCQSGNINPTLKFILASLGLVLLGMGLGELAIRHARTKSQAAASKALENYNRSEYSIKEISPPPNKIKEWSETQSATKELLQIGISNEPLVKIFGYDWRNGVPTVEALFTNLEMQSLWEPVLLGKSNGFWRVRFKEPPAILTYTVKTPVWETTNAIEIIPDHEKKVPPCTLIRYIENGVTNEFHAWACPVEVWTNVWRSNVPGKARTPDFKPLETP